MVKSRVKAKLDKSIRRPVVVSTAIIRPTGLLDPKITLKPIANQVDDVLEQVRRRIKKGQRVIITTLTKKFAEELDLYFKQINIKSAYIHSGVDTLERLDILADLRRGRYDVLIGINLLREGLDLPEVSLVAIFDADKEGFLRSKTSLIQIIGRAARHSEGEVIMYADKMTDSMKAAIDETTDRREKQEAYNKKHGITPKSTSRKLETIADEVREETAKNEDFGKSEITYSPMGFVDKKEEEVEFNIDSRHSRTKKRSRSIHGDRAQKTEKGKAKQVYAGFDAAKQVLMDKLSNYSDSELKERLQIAIDALNFEEAAAIRDLVKKRKSEADSQFS